MSDLIFIPEERLQQGSQPWLERRRIVGTATQCAVVMGEPLSYPDSPKTWRELRQERAFGSTFKGNADTERGKRLEPLALAKFNDYFSGAIDAMQPIWAERRIDGEGVQSVLDWDQPDDLPQIDGPIIASSYDGYSFTSTRHTWVEIKCPRSTSSKTWVAVEEGRIPDDYYWQIVHQRATFGDQPAFGYFMVYLNDEEWKAMPIAVDPRWKSGQFAEDVKRVEVEWRKFLNNEEQPNDMYSNEDWRSLEDQLVRNRNERVSIELQAKPFVENEEAAKEELREMIEQSFSPGEQRRVYGKRLSFSNHPKQEFDMDAFLATYDEAEMRDLYSKSVWDTERLSHDYPGFVTTTDNWRVHIKG